MNKGALRRFPATGLCGARLLSLAQPRKHPDYLAFSKPIGTNGLLLPWFTLWSDRMPLAERSSLPLPAMRDRNAALE